jgi:nucleotide-binding universal stress UspA family protein
MTRIVARVDGSNYDSGVCQHAAWLAGRMNGRILAIHTRDRDAVAMLDGPSPEAILEMALKELRDQGIEDAEARLAAGDLVEAVLAVNADALVIGERGRGSQLDGGRGTGVQVEAVLRRTTLPTCLASQYFLPIHRALVLLDPDPDRQEAVNFIASNEDLRSLDIDLVIANSEDEPPRDKLQWARDMLAAEEVQIFTIQADGLGSAVAQYLESRRLDLLILSRPVLLPPEDDRGRRLETRGLWAFRAPVLVC